MTAKVNSSSTCMNASYLRSAFVPQVNYSYKGQIISMPDALDPNYTSTIDNFVTSTNYTILDGQAITTLAMAAYKNTSAYWAILAFNGIPHPLSIPSSTQLKVPAITSIQNGSRETTNASVGINSGTVTITEVSI